MSTRSRERGFPELAQTDNNTTSEDLRGFPELTQTDSNKTSEDFSGYSILRLRICVILDYNLCLYQI